MKIEKGKAGGMTVLAPKEGLNHQTRDEMEGHFNECLDQFRTKIILDCKEVPYFDSEGLEMLIATDEKLRKRGGILKIIGLNSLCRDIFVSTRLINTLHIYNDIHEAIKDVI